MAWWSPRTAAASSTAWSIRCALSKPSVRSSALTACTGAISSSRLMKRKAAELYVLIAGGGRGTVIVTGVIDARRAAAAKKAESKQAVLAGGSAYAPEDDAALADAAGTINYEVICRPTGRSVRKYEGGIRK